MSTEHKVLHHDRGQKFNPLNPHDGSLVKTLDEHAKEGWSLLSFDWQSCRSAILVREVQTMSQREERDRLRLGEWEPPSAVIYRTADRPMLAAWGEPQSAPVYRVGDPDPTLPTTTDQIDQRCGARGERYYTCTWSPNHPGQHVAGNGNRIVAVWV